MRSIANTEDNCTFVTQVTCLKLNESDEKEHPEYQADAEYCDAVSRGLTPSCEDISVVIHDGAYGTSKSRDRMIR